MSLSCGCPQAHVDTGAEDLLEVARAHQLEGVVAKRLVAHYRPGRRSPEWIKTALVQTQKVVIGGWRPCEGRHARWVHPRRVGEVVVHRTWTDDGRLRHSVWRGLRPDRDPTGLVLPRSVNGHG